MQIIAIPIFFFFEMSAPVRFPVVSDLILHFKKKVTGQKTRR